MPLEDDTNHKDYFEKLLNVCAHSLAYQFRKNFSISLCGKREIFCGPELQNKDTSVRKFIHTNGRFFDIEEVLLQLNERDLKIELVCSSLESPNSIYPKNLSKINCPKFAVVGDTFHSMYPISTIINYMKLENFEYMLISAQPAHLHFFYEAGIKHSALFPRGKVKIEELNNKKIGITYIGRRWSTSHPRRSRMVQFLEKKLPKKNIPFQRYNRLPMPMWIKVLAKSKMVVISSLNGQLTPQVYYCLSAGALCFVDELSLQSLLYQFFEPGKHLVTWCSFDDLLEKIIYYYNHPAEADVIATAGKFQAENNFATTKSFALTISEFVLENKIDPRFLAINDARCQQNRDEPPEYFNVRVRLYENIQELHRIHESLTLISLTRTHLKPSADLADLPRLKIDHAFISDNSKNEADLYFQSVGVNSQIQTATLNNIQKPHSYNIGILETQKSQAKWKFLVKSISRLLKNNSLLWVLGKLSTTEIEILHRQGFKPYVVNKNPIVLKIRDFSRKICLLFWKNGKYPFPYLTLKPAMEIVPNLNVFLRGWQAYFPFLY